MLFFAAFSSLLLASREFDTSLAAVPITIAAGTPISTAIRGTITSSVVPIGTTTASSSSLATVTVTVTASECVATNATFITLTQGNGKLTTVSLTSTNVGFPRRHDWGTASTVTVVPTTTVVTLTATSVATGVNGMISTVPNFAPTTTGRATQVSSSSAESVTRSA
ncbi:hypothetical protein CPB85DRAFT_1253676 [Mucidula mucida]|nr:hypothetical protein CPB85DRAFT_1253676 [Mucidula mucida]